LYRHLHLPLPLLYHSSFSSWTPIRPAVSLMGRQ
jgi:hypothetical protein